MSDDTKTNNSMPERSVPGNEIPMQYTFKSNDWETIDRMWGVNMPKRHIFVQMGGFRLRKKTAFFGGNGQATPSCISYGGWGALGVQTIQAKGRKGETMFFLQGDGEC